MEAGQQYYFCYLYIKTVPEMCVAAAVLLGGWGLLALALKRLHRLYQLGLMTRILKQLYVLIFLWGLVYLAKITFSIVIFVQFLLQPRDDGAELWSQLSGYSTVVFNLDIISVYLVQGLLLLVPYHMIDQLIKFLMQLFQADDDGKSRDGNQSVNASHIEDNESVKPIIKREKRLLLFCWVFLIGHFLTLLILVPFDLRVDQSFKIKYGGGVISLVLFEAFILCVIIRLGIWALNSNTKLAQLIQDFQIRLLKKRYFILIVCSIVRIALVSIFLAAYIILQWIPLNDQKKFLHCSFQVQPIFDMPEWLSEAFRIANISIQGLFLHFLPVFVTLNMFKVEAEDMNLSNSILGGDSADLSD